MQNRQNIILKIFKESVMFSGYVVCLKSFHAVFLLQFFVFC